MKSPEATNQKRRIAHRVWGAGRHVGLALVGLGLLANAWVSYQSRVAEFLGGSPVMGQNQPSLPSERLLGARGLYMMPAQLGSNTWGCYLLDVDSGTISVYRALPEVSRFRLMSVRNFRHDRMLEDFNNEAPTPRDVQKLVQQQRQREELETRKE